jgi:hypothetical protein
VLVWFDRLVPDQGLVEAVARNLRALGPEAALAALERALFQLARARKSEISLVDAASILDRFAGSLGQLSPLLPLPADADRVALADPAASHRL